MWALVKYPEIAEPRRKVKEMVRIVPPIDSVSGPLIPIHPFRDFSVMVIIPSPVKYIKFICLF